MKKFLIILILTTIATAIGLYFRPSYTLVGQLDWFNVLTKGYFVGSFSKFFTQGLIDDSFFYVMRFSGAGLVIGLIACFFSGKKGSSQSSGQKKKK
jgi:hypothetical protein